MFTKYTLDFHLTQHNLFGSHKISKFQYLKPSQVSHLQNSPTSILIASDTRYPQSSMQFTFNCIKNCNEKKRPRMAQLKKTFF